MMGFARALVLAACLASGGAAAIDVYVPLTVDLAGSGSGRVVGPGLDCPADCATEFLYPYWPVLTAMPDPGSFLSGWDGCVPVSAAQCQATNSQVTATFGLAGVDLAVSQGAHPYPYAGRDLILDVEVRNLGSQAATGVTLVDTLDVAAPFVWAPEGCLHAAGAVTCTLGELPAGGSAYRMIVVRPAAAVAITNIAVVSSPSADADAGNDTSTKTHVVAALPAGVPVPRYRLYSPVTLEHHFTTDANEYSVLGSYVGTWIPEGTVGHVLDNPGSVDGVDAVPYYRLYDTGTRWHHWTTDANEYYTLIQFPNWQAEGADGFILPVQAPGTVALYRLLYPFVSGLHHWTIDPVEYDQLVNLYGWIGEGGSGFVLP